MAHGDIQIVRAPEYGFRTRKVKPPDPGTSGDQNEAPPPSQTFALHSGLRGGAGQRGEVGMYTDLGSFGIDGKWNAIRTVPFDLALLARLAVSFTPSQPVHGPYGNATGFLGGLGTLLHLPVLMGFNVGRLTFVLSPGGATLLDFHGHITQAVRLGGAVQLRIASWFAIQPEGSWMHEVVGPTDMGYATVGLGLLFLHVPKYE